MTLPELRPENPPTLELSRADFEKMIDPLLGKSLNYVDAALKQAEQKGGLRREDITRSSSSAVEQDSARQGEAPRILRQGRQFRAGDCDPDAVVARGAALLALKFQPSPARSTSAGRPPAG